MYNSSADEDSDDSLYRFSPARLRPGILSSPMRSSTRARQHHDIRKMFASSPSRLGEAHAASSPTRTVRRSSSPLLGPAYLSASSARSKQRSSEHNRLATARAIWIGSQCTSDAEVPAKIHESGQEMDWMPRKRVVRKPNSSEFVEIREGSGSSLATVEISPPASSDSQEDVRG